MIASCLEDRIRFRHPALSDPGLPALVTGHLAGMPGITAIEATPRTGSVLATHDKPMATVDLATMAEALAASQPASPPKQTKMTKAKRKRRTQKIGLAACMAVTVATGLADTKSAHLTFGFALAAFTAWHLYIYRRRFLA